MSRRGPIPYAGFTLIELAVTLSIVAILMLIAVPSFGTATRVSHERSVVQKLIQDLQWARGAAGAANASILLSTATGAPIVALKLNVDCSWTTTVNGTTEPNHSMTSAALASTAPGLTCTSSLPLPTLSFSPQGFVTNAGTITYTGQSTQTYQLQILYSGSVLRLSGHES